MTNPNSSLNSTLQISKPLERNHLFPSMGVHCFTHKPTWKYRNLVVPKGVRGENDASLTGRLISSMRQQYLQGHAYLLWHQYN